MDEAPEGLANGDELLIALDYQFETRVIKRSRVPGCV